MAMPTQEPKTMTATIAWEADMPDIQSLTQQVQQLSSAYSLWSKASLFLIGATAVVALLYFFASYNALRKGGELKNAQDALSKAKDERAAKAELELIERTRPRGFTETELED